jgi:hypothetical protein
MQTKIPPCFLIGQDSRGNWIAQKQHGQCGGIFVSRAAALKFALLETGNRPDAIIPVSGLLELDLGGPALKVHHPALDLKVGRSAPRRGVLAQLPVAQAA